MKKLNKYLMLFVAAFALASCVDDIVDTPTAESKAGEDVQFGLSLPDSRTVYGGEKNNTFPIYWSDNDKVQIYSPECAAGRNNAEYKVKPVATESYAEELTKTGDFGVQWGDKESADFYSVYPSSGAVLEGTSDNVTAKLYIDSDQTANYILERDDKGNGVFYAADMDNVVMYAQTKGVNAGEKVNLEYNPYSTVIQFEINATLSGEASIFIDNITLTAPVNISGDFVFSFNDAKVTAGGNNGKVVSMDFGVKPQLTATNSKLIAKLCLMPISGVDNLSGWTVTINGREGDGTVLTKTKKLDAASGALAPGKIHKVILPPISSTKKWEYTPSNWMPQLPEYETIYLTELSIPGAWYAGQKTDDGYQNTTCFEDFWIAGIRAFAVECRAYTPRTGFLGGGDLSNDKPTRIVMSGNGSEKYGAYTHQWAQESNMVWVSGVISSIANQVKDTDEFAVLVLNYAYGSEGGYRQLDFENFLALIGNEITTSGATNIVTEITPNTMIGNVKGQLIIKVNVDGRVNFASGNTINAMFSATPLFSDLIPNNIYYSEMKKGSWETSDYVYTNTYTGFENKYTWCFTNANRTQTDKNGNADLPTYSQRKTALNTMAKYSKSIYEKSNHNVWFYFNAGGTQSTKIDDSGDPEAFAKEMNPWLYNLIDRKTNGGYDDDGVLVSSDPSSLGIVMFNKCTVDDDTYKGAAIVRAIIEMNNKFKLKHGTATAKSAYDGTLTTGGNAY